MNDHTTDKALLVALVIVILVAALYTGEAKLYDGFLISLGVAANRIGSRVDPQSTP